MPILFNKTNRTFRLDAKDTSYLIQILDEEDFIAHAYWGPRLCDADGSYCMTGLFLPSKINRERQTFMTTMPQEYPTQDVGDFRHYALGVYDKNGHQACSLNYISHEIMSGKCPLEGLPATFGSDDDCTTLIIHAADPVLELEAKLIYTVFEDLDVITRSVIITNHASDPIRLSRVLSASVDFDRDDLDMLSLYGGWARENNLQREPVRHGLRTIRSNRGISSNVYNPFVGFMAHDASEDAGDVYGFSFVYSGNFMATAELDEYGSIRASIGIDDETFGWKLQPGESFTSPETAMVYSSQGLTGMTHTYHDLYRNHLIRGKYAHVMRPVLINNWEATYFNFNTDKLLKLAATAAKAGIELFVMDDGWFGSRRDDNRGLGDWVVCEDLLPGGLKPLVDQINALGMKFGIWMEPEMVNEDSDLYRAHPDWAITIPGRLKTLRRNQLVLDFSRKDVRDYIYDMLSKVLKSANVEYIKWDMNRHLCNLGSALLPADRQQELCHRYILGVYDLQERIHNDFPDILLENCASGGSRFDAGMLYYSPQIWTSDNTDAIARLKIQAGTALVYPLSAIDANISIVPNHQTGRVTPFQTRADVAMCGTFGYQLDINRIPQEELDQIPSQIEHFHRFNPLVTSGDYYRLDDIFAKQQDYGSWMIVSKDRSEALVTYVKVVSKAADFMRTKIRLKGLEPDAFYQVEGTDAVLSGTFLMKSGLYVNLPREDYASTTVHLFKVQTDE